MFIARKWAVVAIGRGLWGMCRTRSIAKWCFASTLRATPASAAADTRVSKRAAASAHCSSLVVVCPSWTPKYRNFVTTGISSHCGVTATTTGIKALLPTLAAKAGARSKALRTSKTPESCEGLAIRTAMSSQYPNTCSAETTPANASSNKTAPSVKIEVLSGHPCGTPEYMVKVMSNVGRSSAYLGCRGLV